MTKSEIYLLVDNVNFNSYVRVAVYETSATHVQFAGAREKVFHKKHRSVLVFVSRARLWP